MVPGDGSYLGLLRAAWDFLSSSGLWGEDVLPEKSGGSGRSARSGRAFLSAFFFPETEPSFKLRQTGGMKRQQRVLALR